MPAKLLEPFDLHGIDLANRAVMAPVIHPRAEGDHVLTAFMVEYYRRRASAGLIVTGGSWVSAEAIGWINMPGIYTDEQMTSWKAVADAVHADGGRVFLQLAHVGAISHPDHLEGVQPLAPSAVNPLARTFTPNGFRDTLTPREMTQEDIRRTIEDYRHAAENALTAGFDGVEIHGAHAFLIAEFLSSATNLRTDMYGGTPENRSRFLLELIEAVMDVWDPRRVGLKLSPGTAAGCLSPNCDTGPTYRYLVERLNRYDLAYIRIDGPELEIGDIAPQADLVGWFRALYSGVLIVGGSYTQARAEEVLRRGDADLVAFGALFAESPNLVERFGEAIPVAMAEDV